MTDLVERVTKALANRYRIEGEIGEGGMATVFLAEDLKHNRKVAVKVLRPDLAAALGPDRFLQEIEIAAAISHPHILPLYDSGEADGLLYYVMPFVEGESLRERLSREGFLPIQDAARILREVADALAEAHGRGLIHRDVKPANILLTARHALVADFGVAKAISDATSQYKPTTVGVALGTPSYMAPEQAAADVETDHRADLFALGVVGYEMLTGEPPFKGTTTPEVFASLLTADPKPLGAKRPDVPEPLERAVMRCLEKDPGDRWQSADDFLSEFENAMTPSGGVTPASGLRAGSRRRVSFPLIAAGVVVVSLLGLRLYGDHQRRRINRVLSEDMPELESLLSEGEFDAAFRLAEEIEEAAPDLPQLAELRPLFSGQLTVLSEPPGATVSRRPHADSDAEWVYLGVTPLKGVHNPLHRASRIRVEREGFSPVEYLWLGGDTLDLILDSLGAIPAEMVRVPGAEITLSGTAYELASFLMDRHETTNREYKEFVDAGGYERRELWDHPFIDDSRTLTWEEAMARFTGQYGRPGPRSWQLGDHPEGEDDFPVSGVSWYEAAAYARFREKDLPTVHHFSLANHRYFIPHVVPHANLNFQEGPDPVGLDPRMNAFGTFDLVGNVREWCFSETEGQRHILGAGWNDPDWMAGRTRYEQPSFDRSETNGIRLVRYDAEDEALAASFLPVSPSVPTPDYDTIPQPSDGEFESYKSFYAYDWTDLNDSIDASDETELGISQKVTFDAAYGNERMVLYLLLPLDSDPPYQPIVFFPGGGVRRTSESVQWRPYGMASVTAKSGRAFVYPVYKGTHERGGRSSSPQLTPVADRDARVQWAKDLRRTLDYLETRGDMDMDAVGYFGFSWGAAVAPIMLVVEPRIRAAVLNVGGFGRPRPLPQGDPLFFTPRVSIPVLLLSGEYDATFPLETQANPFFELLGSEEKHHEIYPGGHQIPISLLARHTLDWFDRYLGPVTRRRTGGER